MTKTIYDCIAALEGKTDCLTATQHLRHIAMKDEQNDPKTLLDEFAMAFVIGFLSEGNYPGPTNHFAQRCYDYAEAMMDERKSR